MPTARVRVTQRGARQLSSSRWSCSRSYPREPCSGELRCAGAGRGRSRKPFYTLSTAATLWRLRATPGEGRLDASCADARGARLAPIAAASVAGVLRRAPTRRSRSRAGLRVTRTSLLSAPLQAPPRMPGEGRLGASRATDRGARLAPIAAASVAGVLRRAPTRRSRSRAALRVTRTTLSAPATHRRAQGARRGPREHHERSTLWRHGRLPSAVPVPPAWGRSMRRVGAPAGTHIGTRGADRSGPPLRRANKAAECFRKMASAAFGARGIHRDPS